MVKKRLYDFIYRRKIKYIILIMKLKTFIELVTASKVSKKPLMLYAKNSNLTSAEQAYYKKIFGKKAHGVIISDFKEDHINFFIMTSQKVEFRPETSQFKFVLPSGESHLVMYRMPITEFMKLIVDPNNLVTKITNGHKEILVDLIDQLPNQSVDVINVNYTSYIGYKDLLIGVKEIEKQRSIVKKHLVSKGLTNFWVEDYKYAPSIYFKYNLFEIKNRLLMDCLANCSSNLVDLTTSLSLNVGDEQAANLFDEIQMIQGKFLLENPKSNPRFFMDSLHDLDDIDEGNSLSNFVFCSKNTQIFN
jgi:hypothetical protein